MKKNVVFTIVICAALFAGCEEPSGTTYVPWDDDDDSDMGHIDSGSDSEMDSDTFTAFEEADNICDEVVLVDLSVDGIPAYAQCADSLDSAIWSNDGVNTSTVQEDASWVRTQWSMGYQCTEYAHRYLHFVWGVTAVPGGNAGDWCDSTPPTGLIQTAVPVHGDVMVFAPGSCGASQTYGHVAIVDIVDLANDSVNFVEQNGTNRRSCAISTAACFLHVIANNGG